MGNVSRDDFVVLEERYAEWLPMCKVLYQAVMLLQNVNLPCIPCLAISTKVYRLMQAEAPRLGLNPLALRFLEMDVCIDEELKPWEGVIFTRFQQRKRKIHARVVFNVLGLFPELAGKEDAVVTVNRLEKVVDEVTGVEGPGVSVILEAPGGAKSMCLSDATLTELLSELSKPAQPTLDVLEQT